MAKIPTFEPLGLVLKPNQLGQYPDGAALVCHNTVFGGVGTSESAPAFEVAASVNAGSPVLAAEVIRTTGHTLVLLKIAAGWRYSWIDGAGVASPVETPANFYTASVDFEIDGRISWFIARDRVFVTSTTGVMVFDYLTPANADERAPRLAGLFAPAFTAEPLLAGDAGAIKEKQHAHVVAVLTRHFPDCYEVTGPPSAAVQISPGQDDDCNITYTALQRTPEVFKPGDTIEMYRTLQSQAPYDNGDPEDFVPGVSTGQDYYMSSTFDIPSSGPLTWVEATGDQNLGDSLYTNSGAVGSSSQKRPPPICRGMVYYNEYAFYYDVTEPVARVARAGAGVGELNDAYSRKWGIGTRKITATWANGSTSVTGISTEHMVGLAIGQTIIDPNDQRHSIASLGSGSLTLHSASTGAGSVETLVYDGMELNGVWYDVPTADAFASITTTFFDDLGRNNPDESGNASTPATGFAPREEYAGAGTMTIRATNGANYLPPFPDMSALPETVTNPRRTAGMAWTEKGQPEATTQYGVVGTGTVYASIATEIAIVEFTSDGIWRLVGTGGSSSAGFDWGQRHIDTTILIVGPRACCRLGNDVYALAQCGLVVVDGSGQVRELSTSAIGDFGALDYSPTSPVRLTADENTGDVYILLDGSGTAWVYSTRWNKWSTVTLAESGIVSASSNLQHGLTFGRADGNFLRILRPSSTNYQTGITRNQPTWGENPTISKRFQEVEFYFRGEAVGQQIKLLAGKLQGLTRTLKKTDGSNAPSYLQAGIPSGVQGDPAHFELALVATEIPRNAPAVGYSLSLGFVTPAGTTKFVYCGMTVSSFAFEKQRSKR